MELRCHWCFASANAIPLAITLPCRHHLCIRCHSTRQSYHCVVCEHELKISAADRGVPETHTRSSQPHTPSHPAPQSHTSRCAIPLPDAASRTTTHTSTLLRGTSQAHTSPETSFRLSSPEENSRQKSVRGTDNSHNQGEQETEMGKPGIVSQLKAKFDSGVFTSQEEAAEWKKLEEDSRVAHSSIHASRQQESFSRSKDPCNPDTLPGIHPPALPSKGQATPQHRKAQNRGTQPYPQKPPTKDLYLPDPRAREPSPSPSRTRNTSHSPSRTRISSPSPSRPTGPSHSSSKSREPSPSRPLPSPSRNRDPSPSPSRNPSPSLSGARKSLPSPSKPTEPFPLHSVGRDAKFSVTHGQGGSVEGATSRHTAAQQPPVKQPLTPTRFEDLTISRTLKPTTTTLTPGRPDKLVVVNGLTGLPHHPGNAPHTLSQPSSPTHVQNQELRGEEEEEEEAASKERITAEFFRLHGLTKELWTEFLTLNKLREHCEKLEEERRRHLEEHEQWSKENKRLQGELELQKEKEGELRHAVTQLRETWRGQEEGMQQPVGEDRRLKSLNENLLRQLETMKQNITKLEDELNCKKDEMERKEEEWAWLKLEYKQQQEEIVALEEKDRQHKEELARLAEQSVRQQNGALLQDPTSPQEQIRTLTLENSELKREVTSLREAKDAQEKEAMYWKEENAKQQKAAQEESAKQQRAAQEEMGQFRMQELGRLQTHYDRWEEKIKEMQMNIISQEKEKKQLREKNIDLQNKLQRVEEDWVSCKAEAAQLKKENEHHQEEKGKCEVEVRQLKQEISDKHAEWEVVKNLHKEQIEKLEIKEATLEKDISSLIKKDMLNQEELATLRSSKEEVRCLIRERDGLQEEIDKIKKKEASRKEKMAQLRRERDDHQLKIIQLENKPSLLLGEHTERINNLLLALDELRKKEATQQEETTQLRQERDHCKKEVDQLKGRESTELAQIRKERDKYKEEVDQLKGKEDSYKEKANELNWRENNKITELQQERDSLKGEVDRLSWRESTQITQMRRERDDYKEKADKHESREAALENQMTDLTRERDDYKQKLDQLGRKEAELENQMTDVKRERDDCKQTVDTLRRKETELENLIRDVERERDDYKHKLDQLGRKEAELENQIRDVERERDAYKVEVGELKTGEAQVNQIIQMEIERNNHTRRYYAESSKIAQLEQKIYSYELNIEEHKGKEAMLENQITQMNMERENQIKELETKIAQLQQDRDYYKEQAEEHKRSEATLQNKIKQMEREKEKGGTQIAQFHRNIGYNKEQAEEHERREATLLNQIKEMEREKENHQKEGDAQIARLHRERDDHKEEVQKLKKREATLQNQLKQMKIDRESDKMEINSCKREKDNYKQAADQLTRRNSSLESQLTQTKVERDNWRSERNYYKRERDNHQQEAERLKQRHDTSLTQLRRERDQLRSEAEHLKRKLEVASGAAEAGQREITQLERDLADIQAPPTHPQQCTSGAAEKEVVTLGQEEELVTQGLPNLGNSCYINSVVQCLYHLPPLRNTLAEYASLQHQGRYPQDQSGMGVAPALADLFMAMQYATDTEVRLATRRLKGVLGSHDESFRGRQQQEAHDLFSALVSWLHSDLSQCGILDSSFRTSSLFNGQLETKMTCMDSRKQLTHTNEAFTSLSLPVVGHDDWSLEDLLEKHFREQTMDWDCHHCKFTHECHHHTRVRRCPPVLVIHFSRVSEYRSTRKAKVDFPVADLSLQRYVAPNAPLSPQYQLVGVACHEGTMSSGHYTAYCRYGGRYRGSKWRLCNDEWVSDVWERKVLEDENAHLLFYIQQGN